MLVNNQLVLCSHVRCNPLNSPKHPYMTITNFNCEGPYLPGVICNIVVKVDCGRSPGRSTFSSELRIEALNNASLNLADEPTLVDGPPVLISSGQDEFKFGRSTPRCKSRIDTLNTTTPNLADEPTLSDGPLQSESRIDDLNTATPNLADKPTLANGPLTTDN